MSAEQQTGTAVDADFLQLAIDLALGSVADGGGPFGALVVRAGLVIAEGRNAVTRDLDPSAHAEVVAIRRACQTVGDFRLSGCTVYASTEPCPMCLSALYWARVDRIVFAATRHDAAAAQFDDEFLYRELSLPLTERGISTSHVALSTALTPFAAWDTAQDKVRY